MIHFPLLRFPERNTAGARSVPIGRTQTLSTMRATDDGLGGNPMEFPEIMHTPFDPPI
jgi:hypothetical protein